MKAAKRQYCALSKQRELASTPLFSYSILIFGPNLAWRYLLIINKNKIAFYTQKLQKRGR